MVGYLSPKSLVLPGNYFPSVLGSTEIQKCGSFNPGDNNGPRGGSGPETESELYWDDPDEYNYIHGINDDDDNDNDEEEDDDYSNDLEREKDKSYRG